jgi:hypothetical protein
MPLLYKSTRNNIGFIVCTWVIASTYVEVDDVYVEWA